VLIVDADLGVILRQEARLDGEQFQITELRDLAVNAAIDEAVFSFEPPAGEVVRRDRDRTQPRTVSIDEAAALASFRIVSPFWLPRGAVQHVSWTPAEDRPPQPERLLISVQPGSYRDGSREERYHLVIHEEANAPQFGDADWEEIHHGGCEMRVLERNFHGHRSLIVALTITGTHVWINSTYPRKTTLKVAASLQAAAGPNNDTPL
jgi:hypothetical protein